MRSRPPILTLLTVMVAAMFSVLCACQKGPTEQQSEQQLPAVEELSEVPDMEFTEFDAGWPPQVRGITDAELVPWDSLPGALTAELQVEILDRLFADEEVTDTLGERFAFIAAEAIGTGKENDLSPGFNAVFFSHSNNSTVNVQLNDALETVAVETIEPSIYQPPAGPGEFEEAIGAAREALIELEFDLTDLQSDGILAHPSQRTSPKAYFYDRRVIYVSFSRGEDAPPSFFALVDLTNRKILDSGPAAGSAADTR